MRNSCTISMKVFMRSKRYSLPYIVAVIACCAIMLSLHNTESSTVDFLTSSLTLGIWGFLYFAFAGYEFTSMLRRVNGEECISSMHGAQRELIASQLFTLCIPLSLWSAVVFGWQIVDYVQRGLTYAPYLLHCILAVTLYFFLPGFLGIMLGICLSRVFRPTAYALIIFVVLLCSSIGPDLFTGVTIAGVDVASLFDWFSITVPNSTWIADTVYGIPMEKCRWLLVLFWGLLMLSYMIWKYKPIGERVAAFLTCICLITSTLCGVRFALRDNDYILIKDKRMDGILTGEYNYRLNTPDTCEETTDADFVVEKYELYFSIKDSLSAVATMQVSPSDLDHYYFTLYHGYSVSSVVNEKGDDLDFTQNGDYLDITVSGTTETITIIYSGNGNKYYANRQGISLPGYFAYYPIAGYQSVWDESNSSFSVNTTFTEAEFYIEVDTTKTVYSNLTETSRNTFEGTTDTVSLYAGLLEQAEIDGVTYIYSPVSEQSIEIDEEEVSEAWEALCALTGETRTLSLAGKVIILQPLTIVSASGQNESAVILKDQILLRDYQPSAEGICRSYFESGLPVSSDTSLLRQVFLDELFSEGASATSEKPAYDDLQMLLKYDSADEILDEEEWEEYLYESEVLFYELMEYQMTYLGKETVMQEVYQYLMEDDHLVDQVDFLYDLGGDQDA